MKFQTFTKPYFLLRSIACFIFFNLFLLHFTFAENIKVDSENKKIIAPFATSYQWFYEGKEIKGANEHALIVEKSGSYSVHFTDLEGKQVEENIQVVVEGNTIRKIFLIGDSTVMTYRDDKYPMAGWGQVIQHFFDNSAFVVENRAIGGRSSRSFIEEGRWASVKDDISEGDYLFIQWGHNDRDWTKAERWTPPADYKEYLKQYVNEARALGAIPVLISPMTLNAWRDGRLRNVFTESGSDYRGKMLEVANELDVPFVDLNMVSHALVSNVGVEYATRFLYNTYVAGEYPNYPNGLNDFTHFQEMGAIEMAKIIANGIEDLKEDPRITPLAEELLPLYPVTIKANNPSAGVITRTGSYPAGVKVTLKALPGEGHDLLSWKENTDVVAGTGDIYNFVMEPRERAFYALFDENTPFDCAGDFNGTAVLDNCNICVGGNTQVEACQSTYQMEGACAVEGTVEEEFAAYQGTGYLSILPFQGASVVWAMNSNTQGNVVLSFRFANGNDVALPADLIVNGTNVGEVSFPATGSWASWRMISKAINLQEGENNFELKAKSNAGLAYLDMISMNVANLEAIDCAPLVDCAGVIRGTATLDDCNICSGGDTQIAPCQASYQMEEACVIDGIVNNEKSGFQGNGYLEIERLEGAAVEWVMNASAQGNAIFTFRYANGNSASRTADLIVNGTNLGALEFPVTGSWENWETISQEVTLREGENSFKLEANTNTGMAYLDMISMNEANLEAIDCSTFMDCAGVFRGTAILDDCNICTGGDTQVVPCMSSYQMEEACIMDGSVVDEVTGFKGSGYVASDSALGAALKWILNSSSQKEVLFTFRYANGDEAPRSAEVVVNGSNKGALEFPSTGSWSNWATISKTILVKNGENKFELSALSEAGLPNLDLIALNANILQPGNCSVLTYIPLTDNQDIIKVYPNPFSDKLIFNSKEPLKYKIFDLSGRLLLEGSCSGNCEITPSLAPGLYQIMAETKEEIYSGKILKE